MSDSFYNAQNILLFYSLGSHHVLSYAWYITLVYVIPRNVTFLVIYNILDIVGLQERNQHDCIKFIFQNLYERLTIGSKTLLHQPLLFCLWVVPSYGLCMILILQDQIWSYQHFTTYICHKDLSFSRDYGSRFMWEQW